MAQSVERSCTMLVHFDKPASGNAIKEALEGNDGPAKVEALQKAIMMLLNGEQLPALFITIVRYVLPSEDHTVQKLLLLYLVGLVLTFVVMSRGTADMAFMTVLAYAGDHREDRFFWQNPSRNGPYYFLQFTCPPCADISH